MTSRNLSLLLCIVLFLIFLASYSFSSECLLLLDQAKFFENSSQYSKAAYTYAKIADCFSLKNDSLNATHYYKLAANAYILEAKKDLESENYIGAAMNYDYAAQYFEKAGNKTLAEAYHSKSNEVLMKIAEKKLEEKKYKEASDIYRNVSMSYENTTLSYADTLAMLAYSSFLSENYKEARNYSRRAIEIYLKYKNESLNSWKYYLVLAIYNNETTFLDIAKRYTTKTSEIEMIERLKSKLFEIKQLQRNMTTSLPKPTSTTQETIEGNKSAFIILAFLIFLLVAYFAYNIYSRYKEMRREEKEIEIKEWLKERLMDGEDPDELKAIIANEGFDPKLVDEVLREIWG